MTPEAVARVADGVHQVLREHYERRLAALERTAAAQARVIAELEGQVARADTRNEEEMGRYRELQERLIALVESHAARSLVGQVGRLLQGGRE